MYDSMIALLLVAAAIGAGLMAGVYFAFSAFIMRSLDRLDSANAVDAMNAINDVILRSWFMPLFFGTSLLFLLMAVAAAMNWNDPGAPLVLAAGLTYVAGMFLCTAFFNVPLNNRLSKAKDGGLDSTQLWFDYRQRWTRWNHLRTVSSLVACALICCYIKLY